jgi:uncharacterized membrane protein
MGEHKLSTPAQPAAAQRGESLKRQWVFAVLAFWITAAVILAIYLLKGELNLILLSIALGTMILGIWTKARYRRHLRGQIQAEE